MTGEEAEAVLEKEEQTAPEEPDVASDADVEETEQDPSAEPPEVTEPEKPDEPIIEGDPVSIRDSEFAGLVSKIDERLRQALILMFRRNRSAVTLEVKIRFERRNNGVRCKYETGYAFDPEKYKDKNECGNEMAIALNPCGLPVITSHSGTQLSFDDVSNEGGMTITTDASGVVTSIESDQSSDEDPDETEAEEPEEEQEDPEDE